MFRNTNYSLEIEVELKGSVSKTQLKKIDTILCGKYEKKTENNWPFSVFQDKVRGISISIYQKNISININNKSDFNNYFEIANEVLFTLENNIIIPEREKLKVEIKWDITSERLKNANTDIKIKHLGSINKLLNFEEIEEGFEKLHPILIESKFLIAIDKTTFSVKLRMNQLGYGIVVEFIEKKNISYHEIFKNLLSDIEEIDEKFAVLINDISI